ncbi:hypothetical protein Deipe_0856 [Deinococcus peraridilitoris DSM 19664]|uniref:Uncharacterized protein n=1 Tax=Deinococcus peraridilitoris (strain DSM 19664 / LMG 22246 / CIP 109416 / KR-200) TaxID=937777 RepID=K9ZYZ6_DEIPD|nr:hypothetical protein Deipe_0856 [Deinococcus peraridilitoris DSM 19664]
MTTFQARSASVERLWTAAGKVPNRCGACSAQDAVHGPFSVRKGDR